MKYSGDQSSTNVLSRRKGLTSSCANFTSSRLILSSAISKSRFLVSSVFSLNSPLNCMHLVKLRRFRGVSLRSQQESIPARFLEVLALVRLAFWDYIVPLIFQ